MSSEMGPKDAVADLPTDNASEPASAITDGKGILEWMRGSSPDSESRPEPELPEWLVQHCVTTSGQWDTLPDVLRLRDEENDADIEGDSEAPPIYEMASVLYEQFHNLVRPSPSTDTTTIPVAAGTTDEIRFSKRVVCLASHVHATEEASAPFQRAVVRQFAKHAGADLITLTRDDLVDWAEHVFYADGSDDGSICDTCSDSSSELSEEVLDGPYTAYMRALFNRGPPTPPPPPPPAGWPGPRPVPPFRPLPPVDLKDRHMPFLALLDTPGIKRPISCASPLILHLFVKRHHLNVMMNDLHRITEDHPIHHGMLVIVSTEDERYHPPGRAPLCPNTNMTVAPIKSPTQEALVMADGQRELRARNIRSLQRLLRQNIPDDSVVPLLVPYADWSFLDGSEAHKFLGRVSLSDVRTKLVAQTIGRDFDDDKIMNAVLGIPARHKALSAWETLPPRPPYPPVPLQPGVPRPLPARPPLNTRLDPRNSVDWDSSDEETEDARNWDNFPPSVREAVRKLATPPPPARDKHSWERKCLSNVIDPKEAGLGWSDISMDDATKSTIQDLLRPQSILQDHSSPPYGALQKAQGSGTLIYGPPGVGKTHLAHVLARESGSTVIYRDTSSNPPLAWPLGIQALVKLAKRVAPSILILDIDDADFLSRSNGVVGPPGWKSNDLKLFVKGIDDLAGPATKLLILLSDFSILIPPEVMRRLPVRLQMGLPSTKLRAEIFDIVLRDEVLGPTVDAELLATLTPRFSGSDIRHLCAQAALLCDVFMEDGEDRGKRILTRDCFDKALRMVQPTVTDAALDGMRLFAKAYDPLGLGKMDALEEENTLLRDEFVEVASLA